MSLWAHSPIVINPKKLSEEMGFEDPFFVSLYEQVDGLKSDDLQFYLTEAKETFGPILDCGCGSGRLLQPIAELGIHIVGFDSSRPMLAELEKRSLPPNARVLQRTLEEITSTELVSFFGSFGLVICAFNTFLHLNSQSEQIEFLHKVQSLLRPGGKLILDVVNPFSHDMFFMSESEREFEHTVVDASTDEEITTWRSIKQDMISQTGAFLREHEITSSDRSIRREHSEVRYRWVYPNEMMLLLKLSGFASSHVFGDYSGGPLTEDSESQIWIAEVAA